MKAIELEHFCMGSSTPGVVHSIEAVKEYMVEMDGWFGGNGTEVQKAKDKV